MTSTKLARTSVALLSLVWMQALLTSKTMAQQADGNYPKYTVADLGTLGGSFSWAFAVNNKGWVVGIATLAGDTSLHAFLWHDGLMTDLGILGHPETLPISTAVAINGAGEIVGVSETNEPDPFGENSCGNFLVCLPVVWQDNEIKVLPTLGGTNGVANDVNESGLVGGVAENDEPDPTCAPPQIFHLEPVLWNKSGVVRLPSIGGDADGFVLGVNDRGEAVGVTFSCDFSSGHSVLWRKGTPLDMNAAGGDVMAEPNDINNQSQVAGTAYDSTGTALAMVWQSGVTKVIGALPGHLESHGNAINNRGQMVGQSCAPSGWPDCSVFLWDKGVIRDLNDLVSGSSLTLVESGKINDLGQIVGLAFTSSGELHAFLATPNDDESGDVHTSAALAEPMRSSAALPEVVQKTIERRMVFKSRHLGRAVRLEN